MCGLLIRRASRYYVLNSGLEFLTIHPEGFVGWGCEHHVDVGLDLLHCLCYLHSTLWTGGFYQKWKDDWKRGNGSGRGVSDIVTWWNGIFTTTRLDVFFFFVPWFDRYMRASSGNVQRLGGTPPGSLDHWVAELSGLVAGLLRDLPSDCHLQDVGASQAAESGLFDQVTCPILNEDAERYLMFAAPVNSGEKHSTFSRGTVYTYISTQIDNV